MNSVFSVFLFSCVWFLGVILVSPTSAAVAPRDGESMRLWEGKAPGALGDSPADIPTLTPAIPAHANGAAFIVCPGGGYGYLSPREGMPIARWLNSLGVTGFVLKYRFGPTYHHPMEMDDVQRAIRMVRANAEAWHLDPKRIGIIGFSAGGHLASTAATHFDDGNADATDPIDRVSCRPDRAILIYPVITMTPPYMHVGSHNNLLGEHPDPKLEKFLSSDLQVTKKTPPCFILSTSDDKTVPVENSLLFAMACKKNHVPFELHVFEHGRHGFALGEDDPILKTWTEIAGHWLERQGFAGDKSETNSK